jgi:ATP-dependent Lhr-like helicase
MPISLLFREDLPLLMPVNDTRADMRAHAQVAWEVLAERGALFFTELKQATGLLATQLEEALRELAALGLATADGFAAVRHLVGRERGARRAKQRSLSPTSGPLGRWSLFPGRVALPPEVDRLERWCRQLLARYGVVFRELLTRESSAPAWQALVPVFRRMEMRGEIRGGRFVLGVAGEQYATTEAIELLRAVREPDPNEPWLVLSAADPLNLVGIITPGARVVANHRNALVLCAGRCMASLQSRRAEFHETVDLATQWEMRQAMVQGRRRAADLTHAAMPRRWRVAPPADR